MRSTLPLAELLSKSTPYVQGAFSEVSAYVGFRDSLLLLFSVAARFREAQALKYSRYDNLTAM